MIATASNVKDYIALINAYCKDEISREEFWQKYENYFYRENNLLF